MSWPYVVKCRVSGKWRFYSGFSTAGAAARAVMMMQSLGVPTFVRVAKGAPALGALPLSQVSHEVANRNAS